MKEIVKTSRLAGQLEKLFNLLNRDFFNGELPTPIITIQSTPKAYGHYSKFDAWSVKGEGHREINIGAGTLDRPIEYTVATLMHEMCHMLNDIVLSVQDTSRGGTYHNCAFRDAAAAHGLTVTRSDKYGWSCTAPADALIDWMLENDVCDILMYRDEPHGIRVAGGNNTANGGALVTGTPAKTNSIRWHCPGCGAIVRSTKAVNIVCGDCLTPFVMG